MFLESGVEAPRKPREHDLGGRIDLKRGNQLFEVKRGARSLRTLQAGILTLAQALLDDDTLEGQLVLIDPVLSPERIEGEWKSLERVLVPSIRDRLAIVMVRDGQFSGHPSTPDPGIQEYISESLATGTHDAVSLRRPEYFFIVLSILMNRWFLNRGPVTAKHLGELAGCSYPTVASAVDRLVPYLLRHSDRSIELERFPHEPWLEYSSASRRLRGTRTFADGSGQPRSVDALLNRLSTRCDIDRGIGVGGILGARHWYPALDISGTPRLDFSIHCPTDTCDLDFVEQLDPALMETERDDPRAVLAVHFVRSAVSPFVDGPSWSYADPVECLLDLHELRLSQQAEDFVGHFSASRES